MSKTSARIIKDSLIDDTRVITLEATFPRFILSEFNTHRVFSRNSASSRARSVTLTFQEIVEEPFIPSPFTQNQKGMSGKPITDEALQEECETYWLEARDKAVLSALDLLVGQEKRTELIGDDISQFKKVIDAYDMEEDLPSVHKQHVNRLLEPFMYHTAIFTATLFDNFFEIRIAGDVQPEMRKLAEAIKGAIDNSEPQERVLHLPYVDSEDAQSFDIKRSCVSCAVISYRSPDELKEAMVDRIFDDLATKKHMSPFEHIACSEGYLDTLLEKMDWTLAQEKDQLDLVGNFSGGVIQLRKVMEALA